MGHDPSQSKEDAVFRSGRRDPKVISLQEAKKKRERRSKSRESLLGRIQLAPTSYDLPARIEGKRHDPIAVLNELADNEVFVLLEDAQATNTPTAKVVTRNGGRYVLIFERREMIETVAGEEGKGSPIQGNRLFSLLQARSVGLAVNLGHDSAALVPSEVLETFSIAPDPEPIEPETEFQPEPEDLVEPEPTGESLQPPSEVEPQEAKAALSDATSTAIESDEAEEAPAAPANTLAIFKALLAPVGFPDLLLSELTACLKESGLCKSALLIRAEYQDGTSGFIVLFSGVEALDHNDVEQLVTQAMRKADREDVVLDISFLEANDPMLSRLRKIALHLV